MLHLPQSFQTANKALLVKHLYYKLRFSLPIGLLYKLFHWRNVSGLIFIGPSTEIWYPKLFTAGRNCFLGSQGKLNALSRNGVRFGSRVTLGDRFWVQGTSYLNDLGDALILEDGVYIGPNAILGFHGRVFIGKNTAIGANFQLSAQSHNLDNLENVSHSVSPSLGITIGEGCWFGNDVKVLDGVSVGKFSVIGAGSVITRSIPDYSVAVGSPAKVIRSRHA